MTLEDFEKELAQKKEQSKSLDRRNSEVERSHEHRHRHRHHHSTKGRSREREERHRHHRSKRESPDDDIDRHRHKRRRRSPDDNEEDSRRHKSLSREGEESWAGDEDSAKRPVVALKRDSWMEAPTGLDIDYIHRPQKAKPPLQADSLEAKYELKLHENELSHHLKDVWDDNGDEATREAVASEGPNYTFGDSGSQWRMTKLKAVYRQAEETGRGVDEIAMEIFGDLQEFDRLREEEIELDRRETYGADYVGKDKPSGDLYAERKLEAGTRQSTHERKDSALHHVHQGKSLETQTPQRTTQILDQTALNRLKARTMKAKVKGGLEAEKLQTEYDSALNAFANQKEPEIIVLNAMDNGMLSGPRNEVKAVDNRRGRERGQVEENEDMSIDDMIREERRTRGQVGGGEGQRFAERIAKDAKFDNDLDYMDENATKLAKRVHKSDINIRSMVISDMQKMNRILDSCPLCYHEDTATPPVCPVISLGSRTYLTLPTEPELSDGAASLVPIQHRTNLLECDDDEWEELRNFMKSLTRMYHDQGRDVIFYENAARPQRKKHASMEAVPLPYSLGETAPAFFKEAILSADEEWTQHKKVLDTLSKAKSGAGKLAFRRSLVKEMPYFHVWFELDGGIGHVVEDSGRWPRGDLFARETLGGMLDLPPDVIKKQGRWQKGYDRRVDGFKKRWRKFDWTRVLTEGG